jgi:peroxiredoxin
MAKNKGVENSRWVEQTLAALQDGEEWQPDVRSALTRFLEKRAEKNWVWRRWAVAATVAVAACLFAMFLPPPQVLAHRCLECSVAVWQSLSGTAQSELKPAGERQMAPDFALTDANGKEVKLSELKGKVVLVNFWATWCEGCQVEIPWFIEFAKKYEGAGLAVIGVSLDGDGWKSVKPWIAAKKVNYTIVVGNEELGNKYGLNGMPLTALIGRDGKIADCHGGIVDREGTEKRIRELLEEKGR